jgi:hypothetical protein
MTIRERKKLKREHNGLLNSYHSNTVFKLQKRIVGIMVGIRDRETSREYFGKLKILPLQSQYTYLLPTLIVCD